MTYQRDTGWVRDLAGVIVATLTPFDCAGALDLARVDGYVDFLVSRNVAGLMVGGTTSEFITMTVEERASLIVAVVERAAGRLPVIAHVGHVVLSEALRLAETAAEAGAPALAGIVPYFHAHTQSAIVEHLGALARHVPELPFFVYNYPADTGNRLDTDGFAELLGEPNVSGIKLSMSSMVEIEPFLKFLPEICVVSGNDSVWRDFTALGGQVVVSGNAAAVPELMRGLLTAHLAGDKDAVESLSPLLDEVLRLGHGGAPQLLKEILRSRGLDLGTCRARSVSQSELSVVTSYGPSKALRDTAGWDITSFGAPNVGEAT